MDIVIIMIDKKYKNKKDDLKSYDKPLLHVYGDLKKITAVSGKRGRKDLNYSS